MYKRNFVLSDFSRIRIPSIAESTLNVESQTRWKILCTLWKTCAAILWEFSMQRILNNSARLANHTHQALISGLWAVAYVEQYNQQHTHILHSCSETSIEAVVCLLLAKLQKSTQITNLTMLFTIGQITTGIKPISDYRRPVSPGSRAAESNYETGSLNRVTPK